MYHHSSKINQKLMKMSSYSSSLVCILVLFALAISKIHAQLPPPPIPHLDFHVHIIKGYANGWISGRCYSPSHTISMNFTLIHLDSQFQLHARAYFLCFMRKDQNERKTFKVFDQAVEGTNRLCGRTGNCFWKLKEDGIYFATDNVTYTREFGWNR
ncbi:uncharacterized protein LOC126667350 [Mercurialis annua]|uniref:uncharacterized protein LOC126667350 n=1 Tax=Mercurialis annua TaxID=3986 RepID=UPI0021606A14|nr:uncharacterized protein LOC126667350 [Mercurialis annua]